MKSFLKYFSCERYTELASKEIDAPLTSKEQFGLSFHHIFCTFCRRSRRQFQLIERALASTLGEPNDFESETMISNPKLSPEAKEKIRKALSDNT